MAAEQDVEVEDDLARGAWLIIPGSLHLMKPPVLKPKNV
jgi:hypothetical protein